MSALGLAAVQLGALAWARWFALLVVQPLLRVGVGAQWWTVAAALAAVMALGDATGVAALPAALPLAIFVQRLGAELALGAVIGVCLSLGGHAVHGAAAVPAAVLRVPPGPWGALVAALVVGAAFELGLHHAAMVSGAALRDTFAIGDVGGALAHAETIVARLPTWLAGMTVLGLALATPALLVTAATELAAAAVARGPGAAAALAQAAVATLRLGAVLVALGASLAIDLHSWAAAALPVTGAGVDRLAPGDR